ncbi:MAG TPA: Ig-like domain repeat protein [Thermoanaerobaculia bacterium]|nr:Ig-like domain repeat protein [Thermoanaerobaculia bacterium]
MIAVAGFAQDDEVPVTLHPNSRTFLSDTALIVMDNDQPQTIDTIRQAVESVDGHLIIYAHPGILIVQIPDEGVAAVAATQNVRVITKSPFDPAALDITDRNALLAVSYFNWIVSGRADAAMDRPRDANQQPEMSTDGDVTQPSGAQAVALANGDHQTLGTSVLVNLVFLNGGPSTWTQTDESTAYNNTAAALSWWNSRVLQQFGVSRPSVMPFFSIQTYEFSVGSSPVDSYDAPTWANAAMNVACGGICRWFDTAAQGRRDAQTNVRNWNIATRNVSGFSDSFTGFLIHSGITISRGGTSPHLPVGGYNEILGGAWWAIGNDIAYPEVPAHETGHVYWACDEYDDAALSVHPSCADCNGPRNALNANADTTGSSCVIPDHKHICIMKFPEGESFSLITNDLDSEYKKVCPYTRIQINWWSDNSCYADVNWDLPGRGATHWEGTYWSDSHAPRMPLVHWSGGPQLTRDDGGGDTLDFNFITNPVTGICITGSASGTRTTDFSARWRRVVNFNFGTYRFHGTADDAVQIYVDGYQLQPTATPGTFQNIELNGLHTVQVDYYQTSGNANVHVDWVQVPNPTCGFFYGQLKPYQKTDYCLSETNVPHLQVFIVGGGGAAPYHVSVQRNNDVPITYTTTTTVADIYPQGVMGDSTYKLVSVVDNNGCQGQIDGSATSVKVNLDSSTPRVNGNVHPTQSGTSCSVALTWDPAFDCNGGPISYEMVRQHFVGNTPVNDTLFACAQWTSFQDNDVHDGTVYAYVLTAVLGTNCSTGTKRRYQPALKLVSCTATPSAIATSSLTASYGDQPTLTAHLTGNGSALPNRAVEFNLNGVLAGSGTTDGSGNATTTATVSLNPGTYTGGLQVRFSGDDAWSASTATADVIVQQTCLPASITSQPAGQTINAGSSATLSIGVTGTAPVTVKWYTTAGALVGGSNNVTVTPSWTTTYYAMVSNDCHTVQSSTVTITIRQPATITWSAPAAITYGAAVSATQLNATSNVSGTFTYSPAAGTVLAAGTRALNLTFSPADTNQYLVTTATQSIVVNKANPGGSWPAPAPITYGTPLSATQLNATSNIPGTIVYDPPAGTILTAGTRTLTATLTPNDTANYNTVSGTVSLTVLKAAPTVTWSAPSSITYGTALGATQLNGSASVAGTFTYSPAAGTVLNSGTQTLTATFTPTDSANYNTASGTVSITVVKGAPTITWSTPSSITYGTALGATQLNASSSVAGTFTYWPAAGTVLSVGTQTLTTSFTPTDSANYNTASGTVSLTVAKATPTITWSTPSSITYGTALGATQLNASASVAGTFTYSPAAGTFPGGGDSTLNVSFSPTNSATYNATSATVTQHVNRAAQTITWATPATITNATPLSATQLNATVSVVGPAAAGVITYDVSSGTVLSAGDHTITATAAATANYDSAQRSVVLHVCSLPTITEQQSGSTTISDGQSITLSISVSSTSTVHYQWYDGTANANGTPVGTDSASFNTGALSNGGGPFSMIYRYWVVVSNDCGQVRGSNIDVIVAPGGNMDDGG